jgi:hypothetical protein
MGVNEFEFTFPVEKRFGSLETTDSSVESRTDSLRTWRDERIIRRIKRDRS